MQVYCVASEPLLCCSLSLSLSLFFVLVVFFIQCRRYFFSLSLFYYFIYITIIIRNSCCILLFFSGNRSSWISAKRGDRFRLGLCLRLTTTAAASATNSRPPNPALIPHPLSLSLSFLPSSFYTHSPFPTNDSFYHSRLIQLSTTHFIFCFFYFILFSTFGHPFRVISLGKRLFLF